MSVKFGTAVEIENDEIETRTEIWTSFPLLKLNRPDLPTVLIIGVAFPFPFFHSFSGLPFYRYNDR